VTRGEAIEKYGAADENGHVTRFSDSSLYDEVCVLCGAQDYMAGFGDGGARLKRACPSDEGGQ
jgi:hypothetical protein